MAIQQMLLGIPSASAAEPDGSVYFDGIDDRLTFAATSDFAFDAYLGLDRHTFPSLWIIYGV